MRARLFARLSARLGGLFRQQRFCEVNYLRREAQRRSAPFWWSDIELDDPQELRLARALPENGFVRGLATPCHGAHGYLAVVSLGFEREDTVSPEERAAIELASLVVHQRMRTLSEPAPKTAPRLTVREYDCLSFVAEGRTNGEIADRLGVSETTVITHLKNTRYKLGVANRAQAVARAYELNLLGPDRVGLGPTRR